MFNSLSLRIKLMIPVAVLVTTVFVVGQIYNMYQSVQNERSRLIERVTVLASGVSFNLDSALAAKDNLTATKVLSAFSADSSVVRVRLITPDDQLFASYQVKQLPEYQIREEPSKITKVEQISEDKGYLYLSLPVVNDQSRLAMLEVVVEKRSFEVIAQQTVYYSLVFLISMLLAGAAFYFRLQRWVIKPVLQLNDAMQHYIERKRQVTFSKPPSNDEVGELVQAFNTMLNRLGERENQVSHTLDKLETEKEFANEVIETVRHALLVVNKQGRVVHCNGMARTIFERPIDQICGNYLADVLQKDTHCVADALATKDEIPAVLIDLTLPKGKSKILEVRGAKISKLCQTLITIEDVTQVEQARSKERLAAGVFENSQDGLMVVNQDGVITMVNPAITKLLGYTQEQLLDNKPEQVLDWQEFSELMPTIYESVNNFGQWQGEVWEQHRLGRRVPLFAKVSRVVKQEAQEVYDYFFILSDISNLKEIERLDYLAHHDVLTGLANRTMLYRELDTTIRNSKINRLGYALIYLDLDGFKLVNDTYGHDAGDIVLQVISQRLQAQVRSQDLVSRLSGDEFVVLLKNTDKLGCEIFANRLVNEIRKPISYATGTLSVGASVGVYFARDDQLLTEDVLKRADTAMYRAKNDGKGQVFINCA